uniref:Mediator of RNA polymerase II transcription subunit 17 n=1 Tax=Acrobeloides nanus TaxID=290746 RepID=A0A914CN90_9BILA
MYAGSTSHSSRVHQGVQVSVESLHEWKIAEIGFNGVEKHVKPLSFSDTVADYARRVDWRKIVGSNATFDGPSDDEDEAEDKEHLVESEKEQSHKEAIADTIVPVAGPWHSVAKALHESLQQINILLDTLNIIKSTIYLNPLTITYHEDRAGESHMYSKAFYWQTKRKALSQAHNTFENALKCRRKDIDDVEKNSFFKELKKMRESWRIRKVGNNIFGDLGYRIYGPKFDTAELFDITRRPSKNNEFDLPSSSGVRIESSPSCIQVQVPLHLMRRTVLAVSIEIDELKNGEKNLLFERRANDLDYTKVDPEQSKKILWEHALKWAQETLVCRDIFTILLRDSVALKDRICIFRDDVLVIYLFDNMLLKIENIYYPFEEGEIPEVGVKYLNRTLRQLFTAEISKAPQRRQQFVLLPLVTTPEQLDARGPQALTAEEIESRRPPQTSLLTKLISVASHYVLVEKVVDVLGKYMLEYSDPQLSWKWLRSSKNFSLIFAYHSHRNYEHFGKNSFYIRVRTGDLAVLTKENQPIDCRRDPELLSHALKLLACNYMLSSVGQLAKTLAWQVLHAIQNSFDEKGDPAPTLYACNQNATRLLFMQFHSSGQPPTLRVRKFSQGETTLSNNIDDFTELQYDRLVGSSFMKKMDNLLSLLRN